MAEALQALYPDVKFTIGPPIDQGFYYDVDLGDQTLSADELEKIEEKMVELARRDANTSGTRSRRRTRSSTTRRRATSTSWS
jgi:threonyl-tRNA synthetase (EC 6.1.1.3)/Ser-tRNA(Thr) hydrolase (EC 3.1.1.-)